MRPPATADQLLEDRDLMPTTDLRAVAKGLLTGHFRLSSAALNTVFPASESVQPLRGLVRAA